MPKFTHLSNVSIDGIAGSSAQGVFLGQTATALSELDAGAHKGCILLYVGEDADGLKKNCLYVCDGESWSLLSLSSGAVDALVLTPGMAVVTDADGLISTAEVTAEELASLTGIEGNVQEALDALLGKFQSYYTKEETDSLLEEAAETVDGTLESYYTKEESDARLEETLESYYTKEEADAAASAAIAEAEESYYTKDETYDRDSVNDLIAAVNSFDVVVADELPESADSHTVYFVPSSNPQEDNVYDEFIHLSDGWEQIGSTAFTLHVEQGEDGIELNGTPLQDATAEQAGLMTAEQVSELAKATEDVVALQASKIEGGEGVAVETSEEEEGATTTVVSLKELDDSPEGEYGSASSVPVLTVDAYGRVVSAGTADVFAAPSAGETGQYLTSDGEAPVWREVATAVEDDGEDPVSGAAVAAYVTGVAEGKQDVLLTFEASVPASAWTEDGGMWTASVEVEGMTSDSVVWVTASPGSWDAWGDAGVRCTSQSDGVLSFGATSQPEEDLVAYLVIA